MFYFSEKSGKFWFWFASIYLLSGLILFCTKDHWLAIISVVIGVFTLYSLGYPYFYKLCRGYYPSGYIYLPKEKGEALTLRQIADSTYSELSMYAKITSTKYNPLRPEGYYEHFIDLLENSKNNEIKELVSSLCLFVKNCKNPLQVERSLSELNRYRVVILKSITKKYEESQQITSYDMPIAPDDSNLN